MCVVVVVVVDKHRVKVQVEIFSVVMQCSVVLGYRRFGGPCCLQVVSPCNVVVGRQCFGRPCRLHLQGEDPTATLRGATTQKNSNLHLRENHNSVIGIIR
jgi:hypothetical protein